MHQWRPPLPPPRVISLPAPTLTLLHIFTLLFLCSRPPRPARPPSWDVPECLWGFAVGVYELSPLLKLHYFLPRRSSCETDVSRPRVKIYHEIPAQTPETRRVTSLFTAADCRQQQMLRETFLSSWKSKPRFYFDDSLNSQTEIFPIASLCLFIYFFSVTITCFLLELRNESLISVIYLY